MYQFLASYAQGASDRVIASCLFLCITCIIGCWYISFFRPRYQEICVLDAQVGMLERRIGTLKKILKRADHIEKELVKRVHIFKRQKLFCLLPDALSSYMKALHSCGLRVISCTMETQKIYQFGLAQRVVCEFQGSYHAFYQLLSSLPIKWIACHIVLQKEGLRIISTCEVYAVKEPQ